MQPRPQQPGTQQQRPPQPYGQQQQQYFQGAVYTAGSQPQQSQHYAQVQYQQTQPQQQQPQNIQYVSSPQIQQQYPQLPQGQIYSPTPQPQTQSQFQAPQTNPPQAQLQQHAPTPQSQAVTSPHQMQAQFQPQYQVQQSTPIGQIQQFPSPAPVFQNQSPGQFQSSAPQIPQNSQIYQQPPVTYSPAPSNIQDQGRRQSQIINQPQQFQSQATTSQPYQNVSQASIQQTPPQSQVQSPVASLARLSIYNQSPVHQQQPISTVTSPQNYQPVPPMDPPPSHLVQSPPPVHYINQPQATQQQQYMGSPLPATTMAQTHQQVHQQFATPQQQQIYSQIPPTGSPVPQVNQYQPVTQQYGQQIQSQAHTPSPTQIVSQPNRQSQQYIPSPMQTPVQTPAQPLQYSISPGQASVQQIQPQYNIPSPQAYQATPSSVPSTYSQPIQTSAPVAQFQQVASPIQQSSPQNSSPQSQFHSQVRNSIRRKPHPAQSPITPQLSQAAPQPTNSPHTSIQNQIPPPPAEYQSQPHSNTPPIQAQLTSPPNDPSLYHSQIQGGTPPIQAQLTSPPNDPSLYQFHTQEQPVELSAQPEHQVQDVPVQQTTSIQSQNVPAGMDPPQIESEFKSIETVAPKPIHPPAPIQQYAPSPPPQIPQKETSDIPLEATIYVSNFSIPPIPSQVVNANSPQAMEPLVVNQPITTEPQVKPINAQSGANPEGLSVQTQTSQFPASGAIKPLPHHQAFSPSSQLQALPQSEDMPTEFQGPAAYPIHPEGQHQYQPYSPAGALQPSDTQGYFPPNQPQVPPGPQSTNVYQPYAPNIATENRVPIPPPGPPPLHLQNQTPPPGFGPRETQPQSHVQESTQTEGVSQPQNVAQPREVSLAVDLTQNYSNLLPCSGKKPVLTKYTKFYVPTNTLVPRLDPAVQELSHAICETCYETYLSPISSFSAAFELYNSPDSPKQDSQDVPVPSSRAMCQFGLYPSLSGTFRDYCIPQNSLAAFTTSIQTLNSLPPCPGNDPMDGGEYYTSLAIPGSSFCARCFDSYIKPSSFGSHFTMKLNGPGQKWTCDNGRNPGFPSRLLEAHLKKPTPDFNSFAQELRESLQVLPCAGVGLPLSAGPDGEIIVYSMPGTDMTVCLECFYHRIKMTPLQQHFALAVHDPNTTAIVCDLASGVSKFLFMVARKANDIHLWQQGLQKFNRLPKCEGIKGVGEEIIEQESAQFGEDAKWYHVSAYPNIEACPSCFHAIVAPLGASHLFTSITRQLRAGVVRTCNFSVGNGGIISSNPEDFPNTLEFRGFILRHLLEIAWESNHQDFAPFLSITKSLSECAPLCGSNARGYKSPNGRRWFGHVATNAADDNDTTIVMCQECYETHVKDTCLEPFLGRDLTAEVYANDVHNQKEAFCGPFSKVSKGALKRARDEKDWTVFARHWNNRQRIRDATLPLIKMLQVEFESQNLLKMSGMYRPHI